MYDIIGTDSLETYYTTYSCNYFIVCFSVIIYSKANYCDCVGIKHSVETEIYPLTYIHAPIAHKETISGFTGIARDQWLYQ